MDVQPEKDDFQLEDLKALVGSKLRGFSSEWPEEQGELTYSTVNSESFPVPELILLTLRNVMGWKWHGEEEKVRWTVFGSVDGERVGFQLAKFGLKIIRSRPLIVPQKRIFGQLSSAVTIVEKAFKPYVGKLISQGRFTMANRYSEFAERYKFFRQQADKSFRNSERSPKFEPFSKSDDLSFLSSRMNTLWSHRIKNNKYGFYQSVAMVDCYFSSLEHRMVLLRAFVGEHFDEGGFERFMKLDWDKKLGVFLDLSRNKSHQVLLKRMRSLKERIRNPFAHGGYENDKGGIFVHFPTIGAIPANFTDFGKSARFTFMPVEPESYRDICQLFDALDNALSTDNMWGAYKLMEAGIDPSFDEESLDEYADAIGGGEEGIEAYIDHWGHIYERHVNMDY